TGIQGAVVVRAIIDREGNVTTASVMSGPQQLRGAAVDAIRQWRYEPYILSGVPVEIETPITVNFLLSGTSEQNFLALYVRFCSVFNWHSAPGFSYNGAVNSSNPSDEIGALLKRARTIAVVGLSDSPLRPSHGVSAYMQHSGYRIIPVNPNIHGALGEE